MNLYNDKWTRDKLLEYRKLKKSGYSEEMLKEHFGDDIYYSGLYNRTSSLLPFLDFIKEINIKPEFVDYKYQKISSDIYNDKFDYIITFSNNDVRYVITLFFYIIEDIETYNMLLTTEDQWVFYKKRLKEFGGKGYITDEERIELVKIVESETGYNKLYSVLRMASYSLLDFIKSVLNNNLIISIGETTNLVKINLYRNIIKNSFPHFIEIENKFDIVGNKYFLYKI